MQVLNLHEFFIPVKKSSRQNYREGEYILTKNEIGCAGTLR